LAGIDPLAFRLKNISEPRLRTVLESATQTFEWGKHEPSAGHGFGLAAGYEKGSYVATCVEVAVDRATGEVRVLRVSQAFECGAIINPQQLENQNQGAIMMALGGALFEEIHFEEGKILNPHFSHYRVPRMHDMPRIEVHLLNRKDLASAGAGETPMLGVAPAIGNAIRAATGVRLTALPMSAASVKRALLGGVPRA
jgi:isoquinoline 1-oxidoreductase